MEGSSVNPSDVDTVEMGGCTAGCGADLAGVVTALGAGCTRVKVGDVVWGLGSKAYADYVALPELNLGLAPPSLAPHAAAAIPEVGITSILSLKRTVTCLLYTSDAADEEDSVDLGGRRIIKKKKKSREEMDERMKSKKITSD
eukprot:TRINITY_DN6907_c0_g1_i1.p3 TRINITY_DN6907_c0_g1~~TRINITY_DN6907_c0_g1_i1.p3  ORF type:complete len:143 (-),score=35.81 TRINITY_DN6907_c0_g1_i1:23-451(-)